MKPEEKARQQIDRLLEAAGWQVQEYREVNISASLGVAVCYFPLKEQLEADYLLFVGGKAVGVVEAKAVGTTLSGVAEQTSNYVVSFPDKLPAVQFPLPFAYESTGVETYFRDLRDPEPRSRRVFAFHQPETLQEWLAQGDPLRARLRQIPSLLTQGLRECQIDAIKNLELSLAGDKPRSLVQMATGSGKTFMAVSLIYRLIKFANAHRVLFLVDRNNLGRQTLTEFQQYLTPDDGRKFTELYNVQRLSSNTFDPVSRVCITTIQRLYSMLRGEPDLADPELEEHSLFDLPTLAEKSKDVAYNPAIPIETFDFIITDECHRSIYNLWRQVLEYFDAYIIGLTATPSLQTLGYFNQNLVMDYSHERAVADGVNVGYEVYRIRTDITERGSRVESGYYVDKRDRLTRKVRWEQLDDDLEYAAPQLDRDVVAKDQIRTVIRTFKDKLFTEIFPGRSEVPKTLVFAKDDSHAEDIVQVVREEFGKGNEFCKKITYRVTGEKPEDLIASFRNSYHPRIAVTVDMISTGTDIKPIECLLFMPDIKSPVYFEQMKGRGTRTISVTDLKAVTPDGQHKTHFVIVDAVGVCESDKTDSRPLERKKSVPFDKLLISVALGNRDEDTLTTVAGRLARLEAEIDDPARREIAAAAGGQTLPDMINRLLDAVDPDKQIARAREIFQTDEPGPEQIQQATAALVKEACAPIENPTVRNKLIEIKKRNEQTIDTVSQDRVLFAGFDAQAKIMAQGVVASFKKFMDENKDELTALQIFYSLPYGQRHLTYAQVEELAAAIKKPPYRLTEEHLWQAYERLEQARVRGAGTKRILTDLISLVRFALGEADTLEPWPEIVDRRFDSWLAAQKLQGRDFTPEQLEWLRLIKEHVATSLTVEVEDFELAPFFEKGGPVKAFQLFGPELPKILTEVNEALAA